MRQATVSGFFLLGMIADDYDGDGYVDMFVPNYQIDSVSMLYHNNGDAQNNILHS